MKGIGQCQSVAVLLRISNQKVSYQSAKKLTHPVLTSPGHDESSGKSHHFRRWVSADTLQPNTRMEMRVNPSSDFLVDPWYRLKVTKPRHLHAAGRAEVIQQRAFAGGANSLHLIQFALPNGFRAAGPMCCYSETMRFITDALQEIQHRIARR